MFITNDTLEEWINYLIYDKNYSNNTVLSYKKDLEIFSNYINNNHYLFPELKKIEDLRPSHVNAWVATRTEFTARANARVISGLKNFLRYLFLFKKMNISESVLSMRAPKFQNNLPRDISTEDIKFSEIMNLGLKNSENKWIELRDRAIILLLYGAGLRVSEALSVNFQNLDEENMIISIIGKGGKARVVPILPIILNSLLDYINYCPFIDNNDYKNLNNIFFTKNGKFLTRNNFAMGIKRSIVKYNLPYKTSPHTFRHSFATHLLENGVNLKELQELLGHTKLSSTEIYTNVTDKTLRDVYYSSHPKA
jgi:integrase/recombinase XerC